MILNELFLLEGGLFMKGSYEFFASKIADIQDEHVRIDLGLWMSDVFERDSGAAFDRDRFMRWVREGKRGGRYHHNWSAPRLQRRHFEFFANAVASDPNYERRRFVANWLGGVFKQTNDKFNTSIWIKACGVTD